MQLQALMLRRTVLCCSSTLCADLICQRLLLFCPHLLHLSGGLFSSDASVGQGQQQGIRLALLLKQLISGLYLSAMGYLCDNVARFSLSGLFGHNSLPGSQSLQANPAVSL